MTLRSVLLSFRIQRFETAIIVGATILSVVVSALVLAWFGAGGFATCLASDAPVFTATCQSLPASLLPRIARLSVQIVPFFPIIAGLLAGGPIVARELESGTARLAWSLGPSRLRWFAQRAIPVLVMAAVAGLAIGLTSTALTHLLQPTIDLDHAFVGFRGRGVLVGAEALLVASVALAFGALLGRLVPTLIASLILLAALGVAIDKVDRTLLTSEAVQIDSQAYDWSGTNLFLDDRLKFPNGDILTYDEAYQTHPEVQMGFEGDQPPWTNLVLYIPGERYQDVERREAVGYGAISLGFIGLAAVAVARRRPR